MKELVERIKAEGVHVGGGIVKVDGFLNHQVDTDLAAAMGAHFANRFREAGVTGITKVITAEVSGIAPALATAQALAAPLIFARKHRSSIVTEDYYHAAVTSRTKGDIVNLMLSRKYLNADDSVLIIDDFLATGSTVGVLAGLIAESGARLKGIGCVIEKPAEGGRARLSRLQVPIIALARIELEGDRLVVS